MPEKKFNKIEYNAEYVKNHTTLIAIRLQNNIDNDIINHINSQPNKAEYLRRLVRADIEREKQQG